LNAAAGNWLRHAREEWASLTQEDPDYRLPHFCWKPIAGQPAADDVGSSSWSNYWRQLAARVTEIAAVIDRARYGCRNLVASHLTRLSRGLDLFDHDPAQRDHVKGLLDSVLAATISGDTITLRRIVAIARKTAKPMEDRLARARMVKWKASLVRASSAADGPLPPSRQAYQWVKGAAGWTKCALGPQQLNDEVMAEEDDLPAHEIAMHGVRRRLVDVRAVAPVPLCDQAEVDLEGEGWARLWHEGHEYEAICEPQQLQSLVPLAPAALRASAATFPVGTGKSADNIAPRAIGRLSDRALKALAAILLSAELLGGWPRGLAPCAADRADRPYS